MSRRLSVLLILVLVVLAVPAVAGAQSATTAPWTSSITYYTPSTTAGTMVISFYPEGSATPISLPAISLAPHTAGSVFVGGVSSLPSGFKGSAVLASDVYVIATAVEFASSPETNNYARMLYSGFTAAEANANFYIPTVLNGVFGSTSTLAIQNTETSDVTATVKFFTAGSTTPTVQHDYLIKGQSNVVLAANASAVGLPAGFNGSATVSTTGGKVVASAQETDDAGRGGYAFEGVATGSNTVYMASMLCNAFGGQTSYYAIQNSGTASASVTVQFYAGGALVGTKPATTVTAGGKLSVNPCNEGVAAGTTGSAVITSTGAPIIAIGKVKAVAGAGASAGMATAFVGSPAGATKVAAPYVRWAASPTAEQRSNIAIMNVGTAAATNITVNYYDGAGTLKAAHHVATTGTPLGQFLKVNSNPSTAGALQADGTFGIATGSIPQGGAVEVTSDQPIVVVVRSQKTVSLGTTLMFAEDYNGVTIP